jgi:heme/copper-type cytochrome/quinol oxidase subunit 2
VDVAAKGFSKFSYLTLPVALVAWVVLLYLTTFYTSLRRSAPPSRPPKWRRRSYLTPPSQAPPL